MTVTGPEHQHPGYEENISIHRTCVHNTQQYKNWKIIKACRSFVPSPHQSDSLSICIFALDGNIIQKEMNQMKKLTTCTYYVDCDGRDILSLLRAQAKAGAAWAWAQRSWRQRVGSSHHVVTRERLVTGENYFQGFSPPAFAETGAKNVRGDAAEKYS